MSFPQSRQAATYTEANLRLFHPKLAAPMAPENELYIFPLMLDELPPDAIPGVPHPPQPANTPINYSFPTLDPPQILVYYRGPRRTWRHANTDSTKPHAAHRMNLSLEAYLRRSGLQAGKRPPIVEAGTPIDSNYIDFQLDMNVITTRTEFGLLLQDLAPPLPQSMPPGLRMFTVSHWDIVCRRCGTAVTHYCTDEDWNGRYLAHRKEKYCIKLEPLAVQARRAELRAMKVGESDDEGSIWGFSGKY